MKTAYSLKNLEKFMQKQVKHEQNEYRRNFSIDIER